METESLFKKHLTPFPPGTVLGALKGVKMNKIWLWLLESTWPLCKRKEKNQVQRSKCDK